MMSRRKVAISAATAVGIAALLLAGAVLFVTQTDWGREQIRRIALEQLDAATEGEVEIGGVRGDLLRGIVLIDISIVDEQGRPFLRADTVSTRYSLRSLFRQRIALHDLRLVNAIIVLDKPPGEEWNFVRIFPADTTAAEPERPGWGDWILLENVDLVDARITVRSEWKPNEELPREKREEEIREALAGETRANVQTVPGGFQTVMDFRQLNARLPVMNIADPDSDALLFEVAALSGILEPFRPPAAEVQDLAGRFRLSGDSLWFADVRATLPGSRIAAEGVYGLEHAELRLHLHGAPVAFADLRWLYPQLPEEGGGTLRLAVYQREMTTSIVAEEVDIRVGEAALAGQLGLVLGDTIRLHDTDLRFSDLDTRLIQRMAPAVDIPRHGTLTGRVVVAGTAEAMQVDGNVAFEDRVSGVSRMVARGEFGMGDELRFQNLNLRFEPLQAELLRVAAPDFPARGPITGEVTLTGTTGGAMQLDGDLRLADPETGVSRVLAAGGLIMGDEIRFRDLDLSFSPVQMALLRTAAPDLPLRGTLTGRARLNGSPAGLLRVDSDLRLNDPRTGVSRVATAGAIGVGEGGVRFRDLSLRFDPLQVALIEAMAPDLPVGGTVTGQATLNGSTTTRIAVSGQITHRDRGELSQVSGTARFTTDDTSPVAVDLRVQPLSLTTVGRFAPAAGLRGSASGELQASGTMGNLDLRMNLQLPDGGLLATRGWLDLASEQPRYDLETRLQTLDLAAVSEHARQTSLSGNISARGQGTDPARMRAEISADIRGAQVDTLQTELIRLQLAIADGLASVDTAIVRMAAGEAQARGSFGLVEGRRGELAYRLDIDSLSAFTPWFPAAEGEVQPRPAVQASETQQARADSLRLARAAEVEYAATGQRPPEPEVASPIALRRDGLAGSIAAAGTLRGSVERFDLHGRAETEDVIFQGNAVRSGWAEYALRDIGTEQPALGFEAAFESVSAAGFAFDSLAARVDYRGDRSGAGQAVFAAYQNDATDLRVDSDFTLSLERNELRLRDLALRFDTVTWRSTQPGVVSWGGAGVEVETLELQSNVGGRIFVDGDLPAEGAADLEVAIEDLEIGHLVALLQDDRQASGRVSLDVRVEGTQRSPRFRGNVEARGIMHEGRNIPDARAAFAYAGEELSAEGELHRGGLRLAEAEARLPVDLALAGREGPRLLDRPISIDIRADSLPLDALPSFTDAIEDVRGQIAGNVSVRGTANDPVLDGIVNLDLASFGITALGIRLQDLAGTLRLQDDALVVDSLVAWSGGPIRISGGLDMRTLTEPAFDLEIDARDAWVLNNENGRLRVDADLAVRGPFERVQVTGDIHTRRGVLYIPETRRANIIALDDSATTARVDTVLLAQRDALTPEENPLLANLNLAIGIHIDRDVWVRSIAANVEIYTPEEVGPLTVRMDRRTGAMTVEGVINTDRGQYTFLDRRFTLTRGAATFVGDGEIDPLLQVAAEHEVRIPGREVIIIRIVIAGTVAEPTIILESSAQPPIPQSDLLSYLAFGRETSSLLQQQGSGLGGQGSGTGALVGNVAAIANRQLTAVAMGTLVDAVESEAMRSLGLDVFHIAPADLPAELWTGRFVDVLRGTEIEAGRYMTPRLFLAGHARPTFEARPGARVEYRTPGGFQWRATWEPRFLAAEPTLERDQELQSTSVFGAFLIREWRF
ncbi:hypothetical protein BH23GEM3_BH23GEM3_09690 [soil metagenome]